MVNPMRPRTYIRGLVNMNHNQNRRLLIIDDTHSIHEDFRKILMPEIANRGALDATEAALFGGQKNSFGNYSFEIDSAFQGQEGLAHVQQSVEASRPYAMAFIDVRMPPGWDGIETTAKIWEIDPELQVVICTAYSDYSWDQMIARIGQSDRLVILKKPFDNIEVLQLANALTEKWRLFQRAKLRMDELEELVGERTIDLTRANEKLQGDIVWRQAAEKQRDSMEIQLRHAQKLESIGQLAAGIAHEINTPTQYIGDNVRFLSDAFRDIKQLLIRQNELFQAARDNPAAREVWREFEAAARAADVEYLLREIPKSIEQTMEGVQRVARIVGAMKDFSHPGVSEKTPFDINQAIKSTLTVSHNEWKYVAELVTDLAPDLPLVRCLPGEFNQVILNLIVNAAHAIADSVQNGSATKGTITISTRHRGNWLEIRIADTGPGIPEKIRTRIFDPFFTTKAVGKGTGQGLAIAHSVVVDKHGGTITFETELGRGTTFIILLPINESDGGKVLADRR